MRRLRWVWPVLLVGAVSAAWFLGPGLPDEPSPRLPEPESLLPPDGERDGPAGPGARDERKDDDPTPPDWWAEYPAREALEDGRVVTSIEEEGDLRRTRAEGIIDAPAAAIFATVTDYAAYPEFMPDTVDCRVLASDGRVHVVHQEVEVAWKRIRYDIEITHRADELGTSWHQTGGDLDVNEGTWTIVPLGRNRCLAIYRLRLVPGFWIPERISNRLLRSSLPEVIRAVRKRAVAAAGE